MHQAIAYPELVGQTLRYHRKNSDLPLPEFARMMQMKSPSGWARVESGETKMTIVQLRRAARAVGMKPWQLLQQADELAEKAVRDHPGLKIVEEKPKGAETSAVAWFLGGAAVGALVAGFLANRNRR